jgi:serine O-acetyltransferase
MKYELGRQEIEILVCKQLNNLFYIDESDKKHINSEMDRAISRTQYCFENTPNKYYSKEGETYFNVFHSGQYSVFLYYLANTIFKKNKNNTLSDRIYFLNKALNGCDLYYEISLPDIFMVEHPVGSVMGRAKYGEYFLFYQGCTVGGNKGAYPTIGENVKMLSNSKIIGNSIIGDNVIMSANSYVKGENIPDNMIVFGSSPNIVLKKSNIVL